MTEQEAAAILAALAEGDHPFTGQPMTLPPELSDPRVNEAFRVAAGLLAAGEFEVAEPVDPGPENQGAKWTAEADAALVEAKRAGQSIGELAAAFQRSKGSIRSRLALLGVMERSGPKADAAYLRNFERAKFVFGAFDHRGHVRVARQLLVVDPEGAAGRLEAGLRQLLAGYGDRVPEGRGFHATLTHGWLRLVGAAVRADPGVDFAAFVERHPELLDGGLTERFYSPERLFSDEARSRVFEPDRAELPERSDQALASGLDFRT